MENIDKLFKKELDKLNNVPIEYWDKKGVWERLEKQEKRKVLPLIMRYAAIFVLLIGISSVVFYALNQTDNTKQLAQSYDYESKEEISLTKKSSEVVVNKPENETGIITEKQNIEEKKEEVTNIFADKSNANSNISHDQDRSDNSFPIIPLISEAKPKSSPKMADVITIVDDDVEIEEEFEMEDIEILAEENEEVYINELVESIEGADVALGSSQRLSKRDMKSKGAPGETKSFAFTITKEKKKEDKRLIAPEIIKESTDESYKRIAENDFKMVSHSPLSTFSIDVDNASYTNIRRFINNGQKPPKDAVRIEEMINFFKYEYPEPKGEHPFSINTELGECPWKKENKLLLIGLQGKDIHTEHLPPSNLVFLIDVSGSMQDANKLPLLKSSMKILVDKLTKKDRIAIVTYAGAAGLALPSTSCDEKEMIKRAIDNLEAGGSTAGGQGIELAYKVASENFVKEGNNRIILSTDGDFNVGASSDNDMEDLITDKRKTGIFITCLGFGMGNYKDSKLELLANKGNGNYAYIDNIIEAHRTLGEEFTGTMFAIAKDVKIQIEFNPAVVKAYRLIGYENRMLNKEDFNNDAKDAGELGAGHSVTALYEIIPTGVESDYLKDIAVDDLKYQNKSVGGKSRELGTVKFRYKKPDGNKSILLSQIIENEETKKNASENLRFSSAVALSGMLMKESKYSGKGDFSMVIELSKNARKHDPKGYKGEFMRLMEVLKSL